MSSHGEGSKTTPGFAPTASTAVSSSAAIAPRFVPGRAKTIVPAGASTSSSPSANVARPRRTTYISSCPSCSKCSSTTR